MSGFGSIINGRNVYLTSLSSSIINVGGGSDVTKMKVYSVTVSSWNSINAGSTSQQTGTLSTGSYSGLTTSDTLFVNATNHSQWTTSSCVLLSVSASTNQAWFTWRNVSASAATPPTGTYKIFAITV